MCDIAFLCNPNDPTERLLSGSDVCRIANAEGKLSSFLVVDEAFIDFCPAASVVEEVANGHRLIVLRSLTKFYALSGIRLGYGVFHPSVTEKMRVCKEPWTVDSLALPPGLASLQDVSYGKASIGGDGARNKTLLEEALGKAGVEDSRFPRRRTCTLSGFPASRMPRQPSKQKGILVRRCLNFFFIDPETISARPVKGRTENERLVKELADLCGE